MVGIIVANIMHYFSTEVSRAIEDYCNHHDLHAIVCNADDDPEKEKKYIDMLRAKQVDGLIIFPTGQNNQLYENMIRQGYPVVFMDRKVQNLSVFSIVTNNRESTYRAIQQFVANGHRRIAFAVQPLKVSTRTERFEGYQLAMKDAGLEINPDYVIESDIPGMKSKLEELFSLEERPTAIFAGNDRVFLEVVRCLRDKGLKIGQDIELVVFDNIPFAQVVETQVTFIIQPASEMGTKAAELLFEQINKVDREPEEFVFPSKLV